MARRTNKRQRMTKGKRVLRAAYFLPAEAAEMDVIAADMDPVTANGSAALRELVRLGKVEYRRLHGIAAPVSASMPGHVESPSSIENSSLTQNPESVKVASGNNSDAA